MLQLYNFFIFIILGIIISFIFDIFRILRKKFKTSNFITYIEDILFWILTGILILYSIWFFNNGEIRIFIFLGIIVGILLYIFTLSNIIVKIFSTIFSYIIRILIIPFKTMYSIISKIFIKFTKKLTTKKGKIVKNGE